MDTSVESLGSRNLHSWQGQTVLAEWSCTPGLLMYTKQTMYTKPTDVPQQNALRGATPL